MIVPKRVEVKITHECVVCKNERSIIIPMSDYITYLQNEREKPIQDIFPEMSADDREFFFISGICPDCWDNIFVEPSPKEILSKIADDLAGVHLEMQEERDK